MNTQLRQILVVPGNIVLRDSEIDVNNGPVTVKVGSGLIRGDGTIYAAKAGKVNFETSTSLWLDCRQRWYQPTLRDPVIGRVISKHADTFRVDIGFAHTATLISQGVERAAKKNRLALGIGDLVYACLSLADRDVEPELQCVDKNGQNNMEYGALKDGFLIRCSLDISRYLARSECPLISLLGETKSFEIAVGLNGRVWVDGTIKTIIFINKIIQKLHTSKKLKYDRDALKTLIAEINKSVC